MAQENQHSSWLDSNALVATGLTALAAVVVLSVVTLALRQRIPAHVPASPVSYIPRPVVRPFEPGEQLAYIFGWNDIPCAWAVTCLRERDEEDGTRMLVLEYEGRTLEPVNRLWSYVLTGKTYLEFQTLLPLASVRASAEKGKRKTVSVTFNRSEHVAEIVEEKLYENDTSVERKSFRQGFDLVSALLFARTLSLRPGDRPVLEVLHGDEFYGVELVPGPPETIEVEAGRFQAIPVDVHVRALTEDQEERRETESRYQKLRVWFSTERRLLLKMEAAVFVGHIYAELVSAESGARPAPE